MILYIADVTKNPNAATSAFSSTLLATAEVSENTSSKDISNAGK